MSGLITQHKDVWDALDNNQFPSPEAIILLVQKVRHGQITAISAWQADACAHMQAHTCGQVCGSSQSVVAVHAVAFATVLAQPDTIPFLVFHVPVCHTGLMFHWMTSQVLDMSQTPNLESPQYTVLLVTKEYEVRRYEPFMVAEAPMGAGSSECQCTSGHWSVCHHGLAHVMPPYGTSNACVVPQICV